MSIHIQNATLLTMLEEEVYEGDIYIEGTRIKQIGKSLHCPDAGEVIDARGMVAMPGLVNCHNHSAMALFRGYSDDLRLMDWLEKRIWPAESQMTQDDVYFGAMLAMAEMIRSGTTAFADMYFGMEEIARAVKDSGMRASLARGLVYTGDRSYTGLEEADSFVERFNGSAEGRITCMFGPHAPYTCPPAYLEEIMRRAEQRQVPIHIHLAETSEEVELMFKRYHKSPARYLSDLGLFSHHVLLAHAVNMSRDDIYLLKDMRGGVAHNPVSNMKLGCGICPVLRMRELGVTVGLGTDGAGSASTLDMFEEIKAAAWMHKNSTGDPTAVSAAGLLKMATKDGAAVLGLAGEIGVLEAGKQADIILIDMDQPHLYPRKDNLFSLLAYAARGSDVRTSIISGRIVMKDREILLFDVSEITRQAQKVAERIL